MPAYFPRHSRPNTRKLSRFTILREISPGFIARRRRLGSFFALLGKRAGVR